MSAFTFVVFLARLGGSAVYSLFVVVSLCTLARLYFLLKFLVMGYVFQVRETAQVHSKSPLRKATAEHLGKASRLVGF